jgi:hypothetical protein
MRANRLVAWVLVVAGAAFFASAPRAALATTEPTGCGTLSPGTGVYIDCKVPFATPPFSSYADSQSINLAMGPNSVFAAGAGTGIVAIECEYTTGMGPGDPPNANYCDAQTAAADFPYATHANGSFDYVADKSGDSVTVYDLPSSHLGHATITCDATHPCVWYVGESYNDFHAPHVFSNPFLVTAGSPTTTSTIATASPGASVPSDTSAGVSVSTPSSAPSGTSLPSQLAYTGAGPSVMWLTGVGLALVMVGALGRRRMVAHMSAMHGGDLDQMESSRS